jgi:hypothetical protein
VQASAACTRDADINAADVRAAAAIARALRFIRFDIDLPPI